MLTIGSLFSGIGGLELGLENAGLGPVLWQVEIDEYARRILVKHWPNAKRGIQDVAQAGKATLPPVDLICGGFPCVDTSPAGRRTGLGGDTSGPLWREFRRVVDELRPGGVVIENSSGLATRGLERVVADLAEIGYPALWLRLSAADVGEPHWRARTWIIAGAKLANSHALGYALQSATRIHAQGSRGDDVDGRCRHVPRRGDAAGWATFVDRGGPVPGIRRSANGLSERMDRHRLGVLGNAVAPRTAEVIGHVIRMMEAP